MANTEQAVARPLMVDGEVLEGFDNLDSVQVYWEDFGPSKGRVTITCYGEAWTAYWRAMGSRTIKQFFSDCDEEYIANRLLGSQFQKHTPGHMKYLRRIVKAVQQSLREAEPVAH